MEKQSKINEAVACFQDGFNCSQAVVSTYCEQFGLDKETALKVSCGFGGGMGRLGEVCGAVTGAYMIIGLKYGQYNLKDTAAKDKTYETVREFTRLFEEKNNTTICRKLLGIDIANTEKKAAVERIKSICPKFVQDSAEILEEILPV